IRYVNKALAMHGGRNETQRGTGKVAGVQAALLGVGAFPPPAARARVLALTHGPGTGFAPDGGVALVVQGVVGNVEFADRAPDVLQTPAHERVELDQAKDRVVLLCGELLATDGLLAALTGNPGASPAERTAQRLDLANAAT